MPTISMFYGIIVMMHYEKGERHHARHLHARYAEYEVSLDFDGEILFGKFPRRQLALLRAWVVLHRDELEANWSLLMHETDVFRIDPLR